jgi:hypothetical protein
MTDYNSPENYADLFADILADIDADDSSYGENIVKGFLFAIEDWLAYHQKQTDAYTQLRERVREALAV